MWSCHCFPDPYSHVTGQVVDQDALVEALQARTIQAAALDVTYPEPLPRSEHFKLILKNKQLNYVTPYSSKLTLVV